MTEVSTRLLSQLEDLMSAVNSGEGRVSELMSMVDEVGAREGELRDQVMEKVSRERQLQSELDGERAKVSKLAEDLAAREAEKDALSRSCEEMTGELEKKESERKLLEERMKEVVGARSEEVEVAAVEMEGLRQRVHDLEEEKSRKTEECERLLRDVEVLRDELNEAKARETAATSASMLPVVEPSVVEAVKAEPLLSSVPPVLMEEAPVVVDVCHGYVEEKSAPAVDEGLLVARLSALAEQVSTTSSLQAEVRNSWLVLMEQAESGVASLVRDQVELKARLGELEADVKSLSAEVREKGARVEALTREVVDKEEELERRECSLRELEASMTEVSTRLLSQLEDLMSAVNSGEGRVSELMSMVDEVGAREGESRDQVMEKVSRERQLQSELDGERAKVSKLAEDLAAREAEKDALSRSCEEMTGELEKKESERKLLEERMKEVVGARSEEVEVAAVEMEGLRQRVHDLEEEKSRKTEECERLLRDVEVLRDELNEAKARETAATSASMLPVVEPSVVEAVKAEPLLSSVPPVLMEEAPVVVDVCHGYVEEKSAPAVDEGLLVARLSALAEQVSTTSSLQAEVRNSWLVLMEQAESGVASLVRDQVELKARLGELEADVKSLSAEVREKGARVEALTREVVDKEEELERRECSLRELEASMTEVSTRLLSQLEDLMSAVNSGEGRVSELMSMVDEVGAREGELRDQVMEKVSRERQLQSELDGERAKVSKLAEDLAAREAEKDALSRSCEEMTGELEKKESERKLLEERMKEVVGARSEEVEVAAVEMEGLRQRVHDLEEEKSRKTEECERLLRDVEVLRDELNEAKARETAATSASMLPVVEPSVVEAVKAEPLLSSVPPVLMEEAPVVVDVCHGYVEEKSAPAVDEGLLVARLSALAEQVSTTSSLQAEVRNSWLVLMEQAESGVASLVRDQVELKARLGELEADVKSLSAEVREKGARVEALTREVVDKEEELERRECSLRELEASMTEVSTRLLSQLEDLMSAVNSGEGRVSELMSMVDEVGAREGELRDQVMEKVSRERQLQSELDGERAKVSKLAEDLAAREAEKDALSRSCEEMTGELEKKESERKLLEERMKEVVGARSEEVEVAAVEMEGLRQRVHDLEEEKSRKTEECERLLRDVEVLRDELNEAKARETAATSASMLPVVEPSVVEAVKAEPLLSSVPPVLMEEAPVVVDVCHGYVEEKSAPAVDEGLLVARLSALAEQVSTTSSLQAEVRNSWLVLMEQAESGVASLVRDQVELKARLGELEADVKSLSAEVREKGARVEALTREVVDKEEELERRECSLRELEASMTEVSTRLLSQLEDLMSAVNSGEGRVSELMSMVDEVGAREGELRDQVMEKVSRERQLQSELDGERAKVSKLAEDLAAREAEKDALSRSCEEMTGELEKKESERKLLEERMKEVVGARSEEVEVAAVEMEGLRQRVHDLEEEKSRKTEECERLLRDVEVLRDELNEAKARETAATSASMLPVVEPSVVEAVKAEPLLSSVPPVLMEEAPVVVDVCHGYVEEKSAPAVDEGLLVARLSALAEQVSTTSSLQAEVRNSWLVLMEQAESGVASLVRDQVELKARLGELEADVKSLSAEVREKGARVEALTREVVDKEEELERRECSLRELEASMTEVSTRLLSQLEDLMSAVNSGEGRVSELMSMVDEVGAREGELRDQVMEKVSRERQLQSELDGERAKVSKLAEDLAAREAEKDALSRSCEEMTGELEKKESERKLLEERMKEVVGARSEEVEVAAVEMEGLRQRVHDLEEEKSRKTEECERLLRDVEVLRDELNEAKARETAATSASMLPVVEPSVVEAVKAEPLLSSVPPVLMEEAPVVVDVCHGYVEEKSAPAVDEGLLVARLSALAEQVSTTSSLQAEVRNSWLVLMEQAESGVASLVRDQVELKARLGELEADVKSLSAEVREKGARVEALTREVVDKEEELERRECSLRELEASMTEVSTRLLSQLEDLMSAVNSGEGRVSELMSMVDEVGAREGELRDQVMEKVSRERQLQSELDGERAKVSKLAEDLAAREAEKDALSRSCEEMTGELEKKESERKLLEERMKEVVGARSEEVEVAAVEMEGLRQRVHDLEEEKSRKTEECERLLRDVEVLRDELNEAKARETAATSASMLPVVEPSVVEAVKAEPLLSSVPPVLMEEAPVVVDVCHGYVEEKSAPAVDEGLLVARLSALAEQVSTTSSLQAEVRNSWLVLMEQAESGVASLVRDQVELKARLGELEADVKSLSAEVREKGARVEALTREVVDKEEELERRECSLRELEASMTEVSTRLLSQLEDLMSAVNSGEGRVSELMSMVDEVGAREGELRDQVMEKVSRERQLQSELDGERAKVSKLAEDLAAREAEKDALSRSCEEMTGELEKKESERKLLEERMKEVVGARSEEVEVAAVEMEGLRQRVHDLEEEKSRKTEECERLLRDVEVLRDELNEAKARETAATSASMLPVVEPSVVEAVKAEPLLSSVPPVLMEEAPVVVDVCHGYVEEKSAPAVDEGLLVARLSALAEQVSTTSSLQAEVRNSWLVLMEQAESGVASLVRDQVELKARLGELEADVKSLSAEVREKGARVEALTREVVDKEEELERRECSLRELEASMTEVSTRLLSQLEDLMSAVNSGEGRVSELMSMVDEVGAREGELRDQVMEKVSRERQLQSELDGERAKVSKLAEDLAAREAEKDALSRSCEEMTGELEKKESERKLLEERMKEVVGARSEEVEVAAVEMEGLRQRVHDLEEEKSRKTEECERLLRDVEVLRDELNEAKARETAATSASMLPVVEPSVVEAVKAEPLLSSVPPVLMEEAPVVVDVCHGYVEEKSAPAVDEGLLVARLSALAEQVSTTSSLQAEVRNSWLVLMEQAESGVASLVRDQVELKARLGELEADVKSLSAEVREKGARVEALTREVVDKEEELERRECSLRELEASMTEVSTRLLSQLEDLMSAVNSGEGRVSELMSMVDEVGAREGELRDQVMEKVSRERQLQSELDGERAKVSKLAEDLAAREAEKDALSRSCEEMTGELEKKESERKLLEERMKEVVGARSEEVEVAAVEMEGLRQRVHDLEEEKSRKTEECERLLRDVEVLRDELNEAKARETAATSASMLPVVEPSVVEAVKAEPLLSSVPPVLMEEAPVVVDVCHGYVEEKSAPAVDEGLLVARLSALAEQVSTTSSLQAEVRNSWLVLMEQAESGVASLVRDQVELKARLGELEADVKSLSAEVREKGARVEALTREVVDKEEELERRECSLRELEASMTEVSTRLLSQLEDLMSAVNSGEGRVSELMSMVDEVGAREGELRDQVMEKVSRERQLQSELDGERAKVSKLAEDLAAREAEKDALSRSCEEMTGELEKKESERKLLEERMKEVVGARSEEVEVAAVEMEGLRQRVHDLEEEKSRKTEECERLLRDVEVLRDELNEAKARETAATSASMLPVVEPSVVEAVKAEPLLSSVPPVLMEEAPVVVDVCHGYVEEKSAPAVDEGLLVARLSALAEQVSTTSSLQAEVRNSWLVLMEQAESGVASLVRDQVELKARLGELEADVKSLSAEVREKGARVEALTREVVDKEEELERRECSLRELEASMTEVSTRLLSQLEDLMSAVNSGEGRVSELMSMVDEVGAREGELRDQVMEKVSRERQLQSELDGERAKVSKLAEDLAAREAEKDALSRSCEEMTGELEKKESERKLLEERMKEVVGARSEEVEVAAVEMEGLRQRVHDLEEEKSRKTEECERLLRDVEVLRDELNEAKARETAATSASMLPVVEPSVVDELNERINELVSSAAHDASVFAVDMEEMRQRLYVVEDEKSRIATECDRLSSELQLLLRELNELRHLKSLTLSSSLMPRADSAVVDALNQRIEQVVAASSHDAEVAAMQMDEMRHRIYDLEDEKLRKTQECDRLLQKVDSLTQEINVFKAQGSANVSTKSLSELVHFKDLKERKEYEVGARSEEVEVAAVEMEGLRQRVHDLEEEKSRKTEECERLLRDVEVLRDELNEAKARETAATSASMLPVVESGVSNTSFGGSYHPSAVAVCCAGDSSAFANNVVVSSVANNPYISSSLSHSCGASVGTSFVGNHHEDFCPLTLSPFYASLLEKVFILQHFVHEISNVVSIPSSFLDFPVISSSVSSLSARLSACLFDLKFAFNSLALASNAMDVGTNRNKDRISPLHFQPCDSSFLSSAADFLILGGIEERDQECDSSSSAHSLLCVAACLHAQLQRFILQVFGCAEEKPTLDDTAKLIMSSWSDFFTKLQNLCHRAPSKLQLSPNAPITGLACICHLPPSEVDQQLNAQFNLKPELSAFTSALTAQTPQPKCLSAYPPKSNFWTKYYSQSEPNLDLSVEQELQKRNTIRSLDSFSRYLSIYTGHCMKPSPFPLATLADQLSKLRLWLVDDTRRSYNASAITKAPYPSVSFEIPSTELYLRRLLNIRDTEVLYLLKNLPGGENLINRSSTPNVFPSRDCTAAQLELMSNWDMVQPIDPSCLPVYRVKLPEVDEVPVVTSVHRSESPAVEATLLSPNDIPPNPSTSASEASLNSLSFESKSEIKFLLRRCWNLLKEMVSTLKRSSRSKVLQTRADELLDTSLRLSRLLNGDPGTSTEYEATADSVAHVDFKRIPDSPGLPRKWSRAPIQELIWAIETLDDVEELRSLAHLLTQQYNAVGTTLEQQLNVNRDLRDRLREANNHLARIYLGVSQGNQRLAVMTERLLVEAQKHDEICSTCEDTISPKPHSQNPISADDAETCAQSGPSDPSKPATLPPSSQKPKRHGKLLVLVVDSINVEVVQEKNTGYLNCTMVLEESQMNQASWYYGEKQISIGSKLLEPVRIGLYGLEKYQARFFPGRPDFAPNMPEISTFLFVNE
ncbi:hypothetical protein TcWFU_005200 [Taenia crassiceps]|uniref:Uncharacterized protein n=1 Tax=Taenia crassiceps TaxID=6207 RepID=A0ABR4QMQ2_9CEST